MKDADFIELLNLYLDHEIGAEDAVRLEAEVVRNPARRGLYRQYCRMHKACTQLALDTAPARAAEEILERRENRLSKIAFYVAGPLAAAAALAFAFSYKVQKPAVPVAASPPAAVAQNAAEPAQPAPAVRQVVDTQELTPVFAVGDFSARALGAGPLYPVADLAWMNGIGAHPLPPLAPPSATSANGALARNAVESSPSQPDQAPAEINAIEFRK